MQIEKTQTEKMSPSNKPTNKAYRFDLFRGGVDENGSVQKLRSVGYALIFDGSSTYQIYLRMFLKDQFYLLADKRSQSILDYQILTRQAAPESESRKYNWYSVGLGKILTGANQGVMQLEFDLMANEKIFMSLHPTEMETREIKEQKHLKLAS